MFPQGTKGTGSYQDIDLATAKRGTVLQDVGLAIAKSGISISSDDAASFPLRLSVTDAAALRRFCVRVLGPLAGERHADLRRTLEEYIRSHGSQSSVSRSLYLHRNTVRQRLRRIEELTRADLDDPEQRLLLQLALLGHAELERTRRDT